MLMCIGQICVPVPSYLPDIVVACLPSALSSFSLFSGCAIVCFLSLCVVHAFTSVRRVILSVAAVQRGSVGRNLREDERTSSRTGRVAVNACWHSRIR